MRPYEEPDYAATRLRESIVRLNGVPVFIMQVDKNTVVYQNLVTDDPFNPKLGQCKLKELDINPVPLGYTNVGPHAIYVTRTPMREDWRQGLRNVSIRTLPEGTRVNYQHLVIPIMNKYPTKEECFDLIARREVVSVAFSRSFALTSEYDLMFKGRWKVGKLRPDNYYEFDQKFTWAEGNFVEEMAAA